MIDQVTLQWVPAIPEDREFYRPCSGKNCVLVAGHEGGHKDLKAARAANLPVATDNINAARPGGWVVNVRTSDPLYRADGTQAEATFQRHVIGVDAPINDEDPWLQGIVKAARKL